MEEKVYEIQVNICWDGVAQDGGIYHDRFILTNINKDTTLGELIEVEGRYHSNKCLVSTSTRGSKDVKVDESGYIEIRVGRVKEESD